MKVIASFVGRNKDFKAWLAAGMPNVICLAEYREKKKTVSKKDGHEKENQLNYYLKYTRWGCLRASEEDEP